MSEEVEYPQAARHCACLGHRAGRPERHSAVEPVSESDALKRLDAAVFGIEDAFNITRRMDGAR